MKAKLGSANYAKILNFVTEACWGYDLPPTKVTKELLDDFDEQLILEGSMTQQELRTAIRFWKKGTPEHMKI